jgi:hypothetical protein
MRSASFTRPETEPAEQMFLVGNMRDRRLVDELAARRR